MKPISTFATKIVVLVLLVVGITASVGWYFFDANKGTAISFSNLEKTIQAQNGQQVSLKEKSDGTVYLQTKDAALRDASPSAKPVSRTISGKI